MKYCGVYLLAQQPAAAAAAAVAGGAGDNTDDQPTRFIDYSRLQQLRINQYDLNLVQQTVTPLIYSVMYSFGYSDTGKTASLLLSRDINRN